MWNCCIPTYKYKQKHKHNLQNSMNARTHFFIKIYLSHFILEWVDVSVVCERWVERHILWERTSSSISSKRSQRVSTLAPLCKLVRDASNRLRVPRSTAILCTLCKSPAWFSSRDPRPVTHLFDLSALTRRYLSVYKSKCDSLSKRTGSLGMNRKSMSYVI